LHEGCDLQDHLGVLRDVKRPDTGHTSARAVMSAWP